MKISKLATRNPITTIMMMLLVLLLGFVSLTDLKLDLMPNLNPPFLAVMTTYPGAGPEEVTEMVTKPVEEVVGTTQGLETMQSRSSSNVSLVTAQFDWGADISEIREDLSSKLDRLRLADGIDRPTIIKFDPTMLPIMQFTVSNGAGLEKVQKLTEEELIPQLENIDGVANVTVTGGFDKEITVKLSKEKLDQFKLTQNQIVQLIQGNNISYPGGVISDAEEKLNLRVIGKVETIEQLRQLPITLIPVNRELQVVTLGDVAQVELEKKDVASIARNNGKDSLLVSIQKEGSANTAEVAGKVRDKLQELEGSYHNLTFTVSSDQGEIIEKSVFNVSSALLYGALFAVLIILIFLRTLGSTLIVGIAIPFSVISTFVLMYFSNMTLNIMSMGGLALGVGMLVDNAIVVLENISRHMSMTKSRKEAAINGAIEVSGAITASTLTTVAVFLPVVFISGFVGELFKELSLTVSFSLLSSLIVALTVVPTLAGLMLKPEKIKKPKENRLYKGVITWALGHRLIAMILTIVLFAGSMLMVPLVGTEFMPTQDEGMFTVAAKLPEGSTMDKTLGVAKDIEKEAKAISDIAVVTTTIGSGDALSSAFLNASENRANINIKLVDKDERKQPTEEVMNELKNRLQSLEGRAVLTFNLSNSMEAMNGHPNSVELMVMGKDKAKVKEYTEELSARFKNIEGITNVTDSLEEGKPEYQFIVDKKKAFKYGLTTFQVASFINENVQGKIATRLSDNGTEIDVRVRVDEMNNSKDAIENLKMKTPMGTEVLLKDIGEVVRGVGPITVVREDQKDVVTVTAEFEGKDLGTMSATILSEVDKMKEDLKIDSNLYTIKTAGGAEMMNEAFSSLLLAMILAIVFVYMIMASQFESLIHPFTIMFTLPLALTGVVIGLLVTGYSFGITAFIGIIVLVGIVVNNAIVFIDYTNQLLGKGMTVKEALIEAGTTRLRPILMTALTTMLGLLPLAVGTGEGAEIQAPMAIAVIGGLFSSTLLTLVVIPVVYSIIESMKEFRRKKCASRKKKVKLEL